MCFLFCTNWCFGLSLAGLMEVYVVANMTSLNYYCARPSKIVALERQVSSSVASVIKILIIDGGKRVRDVKSFLVTPCAQWSCLRCMLS